MPSLAKLTPIPYYTDSSIWFTAIRHMPSAVWLDSGRPKSTYGRYDILSAAPAVHLQTHGDETFIKHLDGTTTTSTQNPFMLVQGLLPEPHQGLAEVPFCGGALGYFSYDIGRRLEKLPQLARNDIDLPDMHLGIYPWAIVQDHHTQKAWLVQNSAIAPTYNFLEIEHLCLEAAKDGMFHNLKQNLEKTLNLFKISKFKSNIKVDDYTDSIHKILSYIAEGDCYQVNFAQRFSAVTEGDSFAAYLTLRDVLPSPFSAYLQLEYGSILSLSPERFIRLDGRNVETMPIKGTIARGITSEQDKKNIETLASSLKDRAENLMIVDLLRNDLSKTCTDVQVPKLFDIQSFANVHHLVSTVTGKLAPGKTAVDLLATSFPGGSITGAPKIRAMEIIEELEPVRRSVYCGSIGYISACGNMDTNIAIRTLVCDKNKIHCWGGGGIVADSAAAMEYQESIAKVKVLLDTLEHHFLEI